LVTLTGAGGAGKTRLAIEVASRLTDAFADGVWLVELAPLSDPRLVPQAVAQALALKEQPTRPAIETLVDHLASKKLLLVLDNAEHLLEGCVQLADLVLGRSPGLAILVTSRERLGMTGELTYRVPSLTVPARSHNVAPSASLAYESVRLFVERAKLLRPDFDVTMGNASAIASICTRLDGMPLAIELVAPRLRSMSIDELSERLDQRFALLTDGSRTALPRHRTLRSMIDWSYDLLTDVEQAMLRRASVFAGSWPLTGAEQACTGDGVEKSDTLRLLTSLADKNLLITEEQGGMTRYRMLETIRQYALDRLRETGEEARWRHRHFAWVLALAEESFLPLLGPEQGVWLDRMAREIDNFRAALAWAIEQKLPDALRMAPQLSRWWVRRAHLTEAREWFSRLLEVTAGGQAKLDRARALSAMGNLAIYQGDPDAAESLLRESLALCRELDDRRRSANSLTNLALVSMARGRYEEAEALLDECATLGRTLADGHMLAVILGNLGIVVHARGDRERAVALFEEALALAREGGDRVLIGQALAANGRAECRDGNLESAQATIVESLTIVGDLADPDTAAEALEAFAELAVAKRAGKRAATALGAAARLREATGFLTPGHEQRELARVATAARAALGDAAFDQAWRDGAAMDLEKAVRYALDGA
jgi:non-specific serine/threonine protein kinase